MPPAISVIIPVHNGDRYITDAVTSVLEQTYSDYEIIVIDDGSTDTTQQVLTPYFDRIRYVYQTNQGASAARNHGIALAQGEYIAFLDADDFFLPDKLAHQMACFQADPTLDMVISGWRLVNAERQPLSEAKPWCYAPSLTLEAAVLYKPARPSATMLRRTWCDRMNGFDISLPIAQDLDFLLRLLTAGCKATWLPEVQVCYRQHGASLMTKGKVLLNDTTVVMERFFEQPGLPTAVRQLRDRERFQCLLWLASRMYFDGYLAEMADCLEQSLGYVVMSPLQMALGWIKSFKTYAEEYGHPFNIGTLTRSAEWQRLIDRLIPPAIPSSPLPPSPSPTFPPLPFPSSHGPIHVLLYTDDLGIGGVRQFNHSLVCHLAKSNYQVSHVHYVNAQPLVDVETSLGVRCIELDYHAGMDQARTLKDWQAAQTLFADTQPDLIVFSDGWPMSNLAAKEAAIAMGIPYMIVLGFIEPTCVHFSRNDGLSYADLVRAHYTQARSVVGVSQENITLLRQLYQLPEDCGQVIHYGRPASYFNPPAVSTRQRLRQEFGIPLDAVVCFTAARMERVKGYQYLLQAIQQLRHRPIWPQLYFVWAGTGAESFKSSNELELRDMAANLGVTAQVKFLGQRWDIPDWLDVSDIFILPSKAEGMPLAVMEAMAKGLPVVASAVSGIPEELGDTGKLLPDPNRMPEATVRELAETLELWASDPVLRRQMGDACRDRAEQLFREDMMLTQYMALIQAALHSYQPAPSAAAKLHSDYQYSALVWTAWHHYRQGNLDKMAIALQQSLPLSPFGRQRTILNWVRSFSVLSFETGAPLTVRHLLNCSEWKAVCDGNLDNVAVA